jgi:Putative transposase/Transposase zinc-binding domain
VGTVAHATTLHYEQRRPESTPLYRLVACHLETFLAEAHAAHERGVPRYVERELRAYLACGIHAHGFLRARCSTCRKEVLVAFSCKLRGVCPSCNARRMCCTAAHLTDRVFPDVPIRQWVLSVPFELRLLLARNAAALSAVGRISVRKIWRWQREQFGASLMHGRRGEASPPTSIRSGAVCFPQRFGGSLNLNVHYHVAVPDGVFSREPEAALGVVFNQLAIPNRSDLETIGHTVELRVLRWLRRRGLLDDGEAEPAEHDAELQRDALDACLRGSLGIGELSSLPGSASAAAQGNDEKFTSFQPAITHRRPRVTSGSLSAWLRLHAGVSVAAQDREGRERLFRYCARPPLSLERLSVLADGRVAYRIKNPRGQQTHRVMSPLQFLARLCALIPPPRHPLVRFYGVFAPHSSWRRHVVALARGSAPACQKGVAPASRDDSASEPDSDRDPPVGPPAPVGGGGAAALGVRGQAAISRAAESAIAGGARIDWATLLKRVHDVDALACPCGGRLRVIALITEPEVVATIAPRTWGIQRAQRSGATSTPLA